MAPPSCAIRSKPNALVILPHGHASNVDDLLSLAAMIQRHLPGAAFVAPNAPSQIPRMAVAQQWWSIETFSMAERTVGATAAVPGLDAFVTHEAEAAGLTNDCLLLVGFSQEAIMALHVGLRRPAPVAGIVPISGMLVDPDRLKADIRRAGEDARVARCASQHWSEWLAAASAFARRILSS